MDKGRQQVGLSVNVIKFSIMVGFYADSNCTYLEIPIRLISTLILIIIISITEITLTYWLPNFHQNSAIFLAAMMLDGP